MARQGIPTTLLDLAPAKNENRYLDWINLEKRLFLHFFHRGPSHKELLVRENRIQYISPLGKAPIEPKADPFFYLKEAAFLDNLAGEFTDMGGQVLRAGRIDWSRVRYQSPFWEVVVQSRLLNRRLNPGLIVDGLGPDSPLARRFSVERNLALESAKTGLVVRQTRLVPPKDWSRPTPGQFFSVIGRYGPLSHQKYYYDQDREELLVEICQNRETTSDTTPSSSEEPEPLREVFQWLKLENPSIVSRAEQEIQIVRPRLGLASDGYLMVGPTACLRQGGRPVDISPELYSSEVAARNIRYITQNQLSFSFENLHAYAHELAVSRTLNLIRDLARVSLLAGFGRQELEQLLVTGLLKPGNLQKAIFTDKNLEQELGTKNGKLARFSFFRKAVPALKNIALARQIFRKFAPYASLSRHLQKFPYFPSPERLVQYGQELDGYLREIRKA